MGVPITSLLVPAPADERDIRRLRIEAWLAISDLVAQVHVPVPTLKRWESKLARRLSDRAPVNALFEAAGVQVDVALVHSTCRLRPESFVTHRQLK